MRTKRLYELKLLVLICLLNPCLQGKCAAQPVLPNLIKEKVIVSGEWVIKEPVIVEEGGELVIEAGSKVRLELAQDILNKAVAGITVHGIIQIKGTQENLVIFTAQKTSAEFSALRIETSFESKILFADFRTLNFPLHIHFSPVLIENCQFRGNNAAIKFRAGRVVIQDNIFEDNHTAIRFWYADPVIIGNKIINNQIGIFIRGGVNSPIITGNSFNNQEYNIKLAAGQEDNIDARNNYWSSDDVERIEASNFDKRKSNDLGLIEIQPIIHSLFFHQP